MTTSSAYDKELFLQNNYRKSAVELIKIIHNLRYEYGYSHQVVRLAKYIAEVQRFTYY